MTGLAALTLSAAPALAAKQYLPGIPTSFGEEGSGPGQFHGPTAIGINESGGLVEGAGDVYVVDRGNNRVERFSASGLYLGQFDGTGAFEVEGKKEAGPPAPTGKFAQPDGVAINSNPLGSATGNVYVADSGNRVIDRFGATGQYLGQLKETCEKPESPPCAGSKSIPFGRLDALAFDSSGNLWVSESREGEAWIDEFSEAGGFVKAFATGRSVFDPGGIAVASGNVFVGRQNFVLRLDAATGVLIAEFNTQSNNGQGVLALALDPSSNNLLLDDNEARNESESVIVVHGPLGEPYAAPLETFPAEPLEPLKNSNGIAVSPTHAAYITQRTANNVQLFEYIQVPSTGAATVSEAAITLHGVVYPQGEAITQCVFEYGPRSGEYTNSVPCSPGVPLSGSEPVPVEATVTGLESRTRYHYRLTSRASRLLSSGDDTLFTSTRPLVEEEFVAGVGPVEGTVGAHIDPTGLPTSYRVEYGTTTAYGSASSETSLGAAQTSSSVGVNLLGLAPGTEYHFRFVATNSLGKSEGSDTTFTTANASGASAASLPDKRAYELLSASATSGELYVPPAPAYHGEDDQSSIRPFQASVDGEAIAYVAAASRTGGSGGIGNGLGSEWLARRTPQGWQAADITPVGSDADAIYRAFSSDLSVGIETNRLLLGPDALSPCENLYARTSSDGAYRTLLVRTDTPGQPDQCGAPYFAGATGDFSQVLFQTEAALTVGMQPAERGEYTRNTYGPGCQQNCNLYDAAGGELQAVNVLPSGEPAPNAVFGGPSGGNNPADLSNVFSEDGTRVFWTDMQPGAHAEHLYMRQNPSRPESPHGGSGECTVPADACTVPVSLGPARYWAATPDGHYAYYTETGKLWRYDSSNGTRLILVNEGVSGEAAGVQGVLGLNRTGEDGAYVYLVAEAALAAGAEHRVCKEAREEAPSPQHGKEQLEEEHGHLPSGRGCNLYVLRAGDAPKLITTLSHVDNHLKASETTSYSTTYGDWQPDAGSRTAQVTADGHHLLFESRLRLTGYNSFSVAAEQTLTEAFVYSADAERLICASCGPSGVPPQVEEGGHISTPLTLLPVTLSSTRKTRWMSEDGNRVFFDTRQALVPQDSNGLLDVYEWEREGTGSCPIAVPARQDGGCTFLLSGGESSDYSFLTEADATGDNVFIITRARLTPQDRDDKMDLYDVRVNGGFSEFSLACAGAGCQGVPPGAPAFATPASATFSGGENFPPARSKPKSAETVRAERLAKALKLCRRRHNTQRRRACEAQARKRYGPPPHKAKRASKDTNRGRRS
jgi:hypothetical protein